MTVALTLRPGAFVRCLSLRALAVACACAVAGAGQSVKLSGSLAQPVGGNVVYYLTTPDGSLVVYCADQEIDERYELYRVPSDGSQAPVKLSDPLHGNVHDSPGRVTPDGTTLVYLTDEPALFRVPVEGSAAPLELVGNLAFDFFVYEDPFRFEISADGLWVVYRENDPMRLLAVPIDGSSAPIELGPLGVPAIGSDFRLSPDALHVVFRAGAELVSLGLYSVPIDGSASPLLLNQLFFDPDQSVTSFQITPDALRVVYSADQDVPMAFEVFSVPIDGSAAPTELSGALPTDADAYASEITPDSTRVLFLADALVDERNELFLVPIDASAAPERLNGDHASSGLYGILSSQLTAGGERAVYITSGRELFSVPLAQAGGFVRLSPPGAVVLEYEITSTGEHVVYEAYLEGSVVTDLLSVPSDGGYRGRAARAPRIVRLAKDIHQFSLHPDGSTVLYLDNDPDGFFSIPVSGTGGPVELVPDYVNYGVAPGGRVFFTPLWLPEFPGAELYSIPLTGGPAVRLNTQLPLGPVVGRIRDFLVSSDHAWTVYLAEGEIWNKFELYAAPTDGSLPAVKISNPGRFYGDAGGYDPEAGGFRITPDSTRVVYFADHEAPNIDDLYVVPIDGSAPATNLTEFTASTDVQYGFELTPDGEHAVLLAFVPTGAFTASVRLHSVRLDGSAPAVVLSGAPVNWANVTNFAVSPDSTRVVYRSDEQSYNRFELFSVPIEGGALVELQSAPTYFSGVSKYHISPDGARVVYLFHPSLSDSNGQLYSIPIDGSAPRQRFGGPGALANDFEITQAGLHVVYSLDAFQTYNLFHAPIDASETVVLNPPIPAGPYQTNTAFRVNPDGTRVAYVTDQEVDGEIALYSVPTDGSQDFVRLSASPSGASIWEDFDISPDGSRVVFFTDTAEAGVFELYSVPIAGGQPPARLNGSIPSGGGFELVFNEPPPLAFQGGRVAYALDQDIAGRVELFVAPLDGSTQPRKVNDPLHPGPSDSIPFLFAGANQLLYLAPVELSGVPELFLRPAPRPPPHSRR